MKRFLNMSVGNILPQSPRVAMLAFQLGLVVPIVETTARPIGEMRCATGGGHDKFLLRFVGEAITARLIAGHADETHVITPDLVTTVIQEHPSVDSLRVAATVIGKCRGRIRYVAKDKQCATIPRSVSAGHINEHRAKFGFHRLEELLRTVCNVASRRWAAAVWAAMIHISKKIVRDRKSVV